MTSAVALHVLLRNALITCSGGFESTSHPEALVDDGGSKIAVSLMDNAWPPITSLAHSLSGLPRW